MSSSFQLNPIGVVRRSENHIHIEIFAPFRAGLRLLEHFSHVIVLWWSDVPGDESWRATLLTEPPYASGRLTGVFACRSPARPNPIAITPCKILSVDEEHGILAVHEIDAHDGTPVLDLKAYFPVSDRVKDARIPAWMTDWPEWVPDEGLGW